MKNKLKDEISSIKKRNKIFNDLNKQLEDRDYITRYSPFGDYEYEEYKSIIDEILIILIQKNKTLEINTSGFKTEGRTYPKKEVIKRYIELGGKKLSLASDAHNVEELGRKFNEIKKETKI